MLEVPDAVWEVGELVVLQVEGAEVGAAADLVGDGLQLVVGHVEGHQPNQLAHSGGKRSEQK